MNALAAKHSHARRSRSETANSKSNKDETIVHGIPHAHAISTEEAKSKFGQLLDKAQENPTAIMRQGKPVAVVLSVQEYESLQRLDDAYWAARADANLARNNRIGVEESEAFLREILNAPD